MSPALRVFMLCAFLNLNSVARGAPDWCGELSTSSLCSELPDELQAGTHSGKTQVGAFLTLFGGRHSGKYVNTVQLYDFLTGSWSKIQTRPRTTGDEPDARFKALTTASHDGKVYVYGGIRPSGNGCLWDIYQLDLQDYMWTKLSAQTTVNDCTRTGDTRGVRAPVAGIIIHVGNYLLLSYYAFDVHDDVDYNRTAASLANMPRETWQFDLTRLTWSELTWDSSTDALASDCLGPDQSSGSICFRDISHTNYAVVENVVYLLRPSSLGDHFEMFKMNPTSGWIWARDSASVDCCTEVNATDSTHSYNYRLVAAGTDIYIFTESMVYIYSTTVSAVTSTVPCSTAVCGKIALSGVSFNAQEQAEAPYPLTAVEELTDDGASTSWRFYSWPYTLQLPFNDISDVTSSGAGTGSPGAVRVAQASESQHLWHRLVSTTSQVFLLSCPMSMDEASAPRLHAYSPGTREWAQLADAPVKACSASGSTATVGLSSFVSDGSSLYGTAVEGSTCSLMTYASHSWSAIDLTDMAPCCPGRAYALYGSAFYVFGGSSAECERVGLTAVDVSDGSASHVTTTGSSPGERSYAAMTAHGDRLYLFGGLRVTLGVSIAYGDMYSLDLATMVWTALSATTMPNSRAGAHLVSQASTLILAGHDTSTATVDPRIYALDLSNDEGTLRWTERLSGSTKVNVTSAAFAVLGDDLFSYTAAGAFYSLNTALTVRFPAASAALLGTRLRASAPGSTLELEGEAFSLPRSIVLDELYPSRLTLRGSAAGTSSLWQNTTELIVHAAGADELTMDRLHFKRGITTEAQPLLRISSFNSSQGCPNISSCTFTGSGLHQDACEAALHIKSVACRVELHAVTVSAFGSPALAKDQVGGAVRIDGARTYWRACNFTGNHAAVGGAMHVTGGSVTVEGGHFVDNDATLAGGAVHATLAHVDLVETRFQANAAGSALGLDSGDEAGGAVYAQTCWSEALAGTGIRVTDCSFIANTAAVGGAIALDQSSLAGDSTTFERNQAQRGGGIYAASGDVQLNRSAMLGNCASVGGGAAFLESTANAIGFRAQSTVLAENFANPTSCGAAVPAGSNDGHGGALLVVGGERHGGSVMLEGTRLEGNAAAGSGGAVAEWCLLESHQRCPSIDLRNVTIRNCSAGDAGGGVFWTTSEPQASACDAGDGSQCGVAMEENSVGSGGYGPDNATLPTLLHCLNATVTLTEHTSGEALRSPIVLQLRDQFQQLVTWQLLNDLASEVTAVAGTGETADTMAIVDTGISGEMHFVRGVASIAPTVKASQRALHTIDLVVALAYGDFETHLRSNMSLSVRGCWDEEYLAGMVCVECGVGRFRNVSDTDPSTWCPECPAGSYSNSTNAPYVCTLCPAGSELHAAGGTSLADCQRCSAGSISDPGTPSCSVCPAGAFDVDRLTCHCSAGYIHSSASHDDYSANIACSPCPAGSYSTTSDSTSCELCPSGTASVYEGEKSATACKLCATGAYSGEGAATCTPCPSHANDIDRLTCACEFGHRYINGSGSSFTCEACPAGTYFLSTDSNTCFPCPAGTFSSQTAATSFSVCKPCVGDTISSAGATSCTPCPAGSTSDDKMVCTCSEGYFRDPVTGACHTCGMGTYSTFKNSSECSSCPAGTASAATAATSRKFCTSCHEQLYSLEGAGYCTDCPEDARSIFSGTSCEPLWKSAAGDAVTVYVSTAGVLGASRSVHVAVTSLESTQNSTDYADYANNVSAIVGDAEYAPISPDMARFAFTAAHTLPGVYQVAIWVNGELTDFEYSYSVEPGSATAENTMVLGVDASQNSTQCVAGVPCAHIDAGGTAHFVVWLYDGYGNKLWDLDDDQQLFVEEEHIAQDAQSGLYEFYQQGTLKGLIDVSVTLETDMARTTVVELRFEVLPVAADPGQTWAAAVGTNQTCATSRPCVSGAVAGEGVVLVVTTRDPYGNTLDSAHDLILYEVRPAETTNASVALTGIARPVDYSQYHVQVNLTLSGEYRGGLWMNQLPIVENFLIEVVSAAVDPASSYLVEGRDVSRAAPCSPSSCWAQVRADEVAEISVVLLDGFGNQVDSAVDQVVYRIDNRTAALGPDTSAESSAPHERRASFRNTAAGSYDLAVLFGHRYITGGTPSGSDAGHWAIQVVPVELSLPESRVWRDARTVCVAGSSCGGAILPGVAVTLQLELRDVYGNVLADYDEVTHPLECYFIGTPAQCETLFHRNGNSVVLVEHTLSGRHELAIRIAGRPLPSDGYIQMIVETTPPAVSGTLRVEGGWESGDGGEEAVRAAITEALAVPMELVAIVEVAVDADRRRLFQDRSLADVMYTITAVDMSQAEMVVAAGGDLAEPDFRTRLMSTEAFQQTDFIVVSAEAIDDGSSYKLPSVSAALSKVFHGSVSNGTQCRDEVELYDEYSNRMNHNPSDCFVWTQETSLTALSPYTTPCSSNQDGTYDVAVQLTRAAEYTLKVYVGGVDESSVVQSMAVGFSLLVTYTSPACAPRSHFHLQSPQVVAGDSYLVIIESRDEFGNTRSEPGDVFTAAVFSAQGTPEAVPGEARYSSGRFLIDGSLNITGHYSVTVLLGGEQASGLGCSDLQACSLVVSPAALSGRMTAIHHYLPADSGVVSVSGILPLAAGFPSTLYTGVGSTHINSIILVAGDEYGNRRNNEDDTFLLDLYIAGTDSSTSVQLGYFVSSPIIGSAAHTPVVHEVNLAVDLGHAGLFNITMLTNTLEVVAGTPYITRIVCPPGYLPHDAEGSGERGCVKCSEKVECLGDTVFAVAPAHWIAPAAASCLSGGCVLNRTYRCEPSLRCGQQNSTLRTSWTEGSFAGIGGIDMCSTRFKSGVVTCSSCSSGYWRNIFTYDCEECPSNMVLSLAMFVLAFAGCVAIAMAVAAELTREVHAKYALIFEQERAFQHALRSQSPLGSKCLDETSAIPINARHGGSGGTLHIVLDSLQAIAMYTMAFPLALPAYVEDLFTPLHLFNFEFFEFVPFSCLFGGSSTFLPSVVFKVGVICLLFMLASVYLSAVAYASYLQSKADESEVDVRRATRVTLLVPIVLVLCLQYLYLGTAFSMLSVFDCKEYYSTGSGVAWFLQRDHQVTCFEGGAHSAYAGVAAMVLVFYTAGWPLLLHFGLKHFHDLKLVETLPDDDGSTNQSLGLPYMVETLPEDNGSTNQSLGLPTKVEAIGEEPPPEEDAAGELAVIDHTHVHEVAPPETPERADTTAPAKRQEIPAEYTGLESLIVYYPARENAMTNNDTPAAYTKVYTKILEMEGDHWYTWIPSGDETLTEDFLWAFWWRVPRGVAIRARVEPKYKMAKGDRGATNVIHVNLLGTSPIILGIVGPFINYLEEKFWYWPTVEAVRKLLLCITLVTFKSREKESAAMAMAVFWSMVFIFLQCFNHPFCRGRDDLLSIALLLNEYLILFSLMIVTYFSERVHGTTAGIAIFGVQILGIVGLLCAGYDHKRVTEILRACSLWCSKNGAAIFPKTSDIAMPQTDGGAESTVQSDVGSSDAVSPIAGPDFETDTTGVTLQDPGALSTNEHAGHEADQLVKPQSRLSEDQEVDKEAEEIFAGTGCDDVDNDVWI
ncbi:hypothetical protein CYMTET_31447 [Cymbomonas tetramitiformis]|uniref:Tyrosine-protein kinase ephrin type A/B receptor-like domain-containing protein n=1 Tax=Cymbomonas tetramitiformis TaxID=36881 RepID=A0AAE0FHV8_9CHLO|nr:hypothetical protein CYMTET_31447 [Cymbomonas tetramitiformis]